MLELDLVRLPDELLRLFVVRFASNNTNLEHSLSPNSSREDDAPFLLLLGRELVARGGLGLDQLVRCDRTERAARHENTIDVVLDARDGRNGDDVRARVVRGRRRGSRGQ